MPHHKPTRTRSWQRAAAIACAPILAFGALSAAATPALADPDPTPGSAEVVPIQITGDSEDRFNMVFMGDGYTFDELPEYREQLEQHLNVLWSIEPYKSYRNYFNVYSIEIVSADSGIDCDSTLDSPKYKNPLKMSFWGGCRPDSVERLITMDKAAAQKYAELVPGYDQVVAIANSDTYGGAGGEYATASGGNALSALITPHEIGHSLGTLQDEYDYYSRGETTGDYTGGEPDDKQHTILTEDEMRDQQLKWWRWLGEDSESGGKIGLYEGGRYYSTGIFRPSRHSQMKTLGYAYDQVSREVMTERISAGASLVTGSSATDQPAAADEVLWVETAQPVYHDLSITWAVNGATVEASANARSLDLAELGAVDGDVVTATVVDDTEFVRDPALRDSASMTQVVEWTVNGVLDSSDLNDADADEAGPTIDAADLAAFADATVPEITLGSPTDRMTGADEVLYINTSHARDRAFEVTWTIGGAPVATTGQSLDLSQQTLAPGAQVVAATVSDPAGTGDPVSMSWTVDNGMPSVSFETNGPAYEADFSGAEPHFTVEEELDMKLLPVDDQEGYVVAEFQLDGDGWHNYYGWPTDRTAPFKFTPTGTNIDDLIYGNLGTGGMSLSPFQEREPGYGDHRVEYRAIDAAGNIGGQGAFTFTVNEASTDPGADPDDTSDSDASGTDDAGADDSAGTDDTSGSDNTGAGDQAGTADTDDGPAPGATENNSSGAGTESAGSAEGAKSGALASTGGTSPLWLATFAALAAAVGLGVIVRRRERA